MVSLTKSLNKKDYGYKCREQPICDLCDRATCRTRHYGIRGDGQHPIIRSIRKQDSDPPVWIVGLEEGELLLETTKELTNYGLFNDQCTQKLNKRYGSMKQADWNQILGEAMDNVVVEDAPSDIGLDSQFVEILEAFLTNRAAAERREDILGARPWHVEDGDGASGMASGYYFRLQDLHQQLVRETGTGPLRDKSRTWMANLIRKKLNGRALVLKIKGLAVRCWWVPQSAINPAPKLDLPVGRAGAI